MQSRDFSALENQPKKMASESSEETTVKTTQVSV